MMLLNLSCDTEFGFDLFDTRSTYHINQPNDHGSEGGSMSLFFERKVTLFDVNFLQKVDSGRCRFWSRSCLIFEQEVDPN